MNERNINAEIVAQGWAIAYRSYSLDYVELEDSAKKKKLGIWSGSFSSPSDYRRDPTEKEVKEHGKCLIKGNINKKGSKLIPSARICRLRQN